MTAGHTSHQTITLHRHPVLLAPRTAAALAGLIAAGALSETSLVRNSVFTISVWAVWGALLFRLIWRIAEWRKETLVLTANDLFLTSGVLMRETTATPIAGVTNISLQQPFLGRLLGYGSLTLWRAGENQGFHFIDHVPYSEQLYLELYSRITSSDPRQY